MNPRDSVSVDKPDRDIVICRARVEDGEAIQEAVWKLARLSAAAAHWSRTAFYPYLAADATSGVLQATALFVARVDGSRDTSSQESGSEGVAGFAAFSSIMSIGAGEATLENMAVAESWQRQGIGGRLLDAGLLWCRAHGADTALLEVRESNRAAIELYQRTGFSVVGRRTAYYRDPVEDALEMQKMVRQVALGG